MFWGAEGVPGLSKHPLTLLGCSHLGMEAAGGAAPQPVWGATGSPPICGLGVLGSACVLRGHNQPFLLVPCCRVAPPTSSRPSSTRCSPAPLVFTLEPAPQNLGLTVRIWGGVALLTTTAPSAAPCPLVPHTPPVYGLSTDPSTPPGSARCPQYPLTPYKPFWGAGGVLHLPAQP